jgi:glycosyltransferase involved in cell wall biosynthesis
MKIAYLDLNEDDLIEDYSLNPNKYGGGRIIASTLLDRLNDFHIFGNKECFNNLNEDKRNRQCFSLTLSERQAIKNGAPVKNFIQNINQYDIFFHHFSNISINLDGHKKPKEVVWPVGWSENVNENIKYILFFDKKNQNARYSKYAKVYDIVIGPRFEPFIERKKENFIFQCSRHGNLYQSIELASLCNKYNIKIYFAGPIEQEYDLLKYINNKNSFYIGLISQELKKDFFKKAKANVQIQTYPISATLTGKEASSYGVPILAAPIGGWNDYIKHGINGFFIQNEEDFINAWHNLDIIKQENCYNLGSDHSEEKMFELVVKSLQEIYNI